ncbi:hypothetical protein FQN54_003620 [Arachnomyces sp. PD_36]|nr:hypothetical protein FQN54_003620 [Arachnomyces sp. PD_36]
MSTNKVDFAPNLTFVSITGPTLDNASAKAMRVHTTRANFARRRQRLVREYADQKESTARAQPRQAEEDYQTMGRNQVVKIRLPVLSHPGLDRKLNNNDAFFINHLTQAMGRLHLLTNVPASDTASAVMQSDWARFLPDPTMLDVSLYFARLVYTERLRLHAAQFTVDAYKGRAIRSVREHLNGGPKGLSDSLIAAVLVLTVMDQALGNIEAWKIHITGLLQIVTVRSRNSKYPPAQWIPRTISRTAMQGLLLFTRHDVTLLAAIEKTGIFDTMFSAPAKKAAYLILTNAETVAVLHYTDVRDRQLPTSEDLYIRRIIKSLDTAIQLNSTAYPAEAFLTAIALSVKIFLETVLRCTTNTDSDLENTSVQLMEVLQKPEQQLCSALALCSSLELVFWQSTMGAIAASNAQTKSFYIWRLERITAALALKSWHDSLTILQRFFWIPSIFSGPCYQILSKVLRSEGHTNVYRDFYN